MDSKERVAKEVITRFIPGEIIGVGTGSTVDLAIRALAEKASAENLDIDVLSSSLTTTRLATELGLNVLSNDSGLTCSWSFDGADSVDENLRVIKGKGGAMLGEKVLMAKSKFSIIIIDESKMVTDLAKGAPVPVEIIPEAETTVRKALAKLNATEVTLRVASAIYGPAITEKGNHILDVRFDSIPDSLENNIKQITGVIESGLFLSQIDEVWIGSKDGVKKITNTS